MIGKRYLYWSRTEHFTLNLASKYVGGPYQTQIGIHQQDSRDVTLPGGVKHVDSDGSGIFSLVISDAASFPGLPLEARAHDRTIRGWGGPDLMARAISPKLSQLWGQPVTVENHPGEGSTAAPALVAKSPADGYTLLVNTSAQAYSAALLKNLPYDPLKDFIPITPLTSQPYVLVAGKSAGITTVSQLVATARAKPGQLRFGSSGLGTATHLGVEKFNLEAGIKALHVPARQGDAITDTIANAVAGSTTYMMAPISLALADIRAGKLRALGVTTRKRSSLLPDVPTIAESGYPGAQANAWWGFFAPGGTPKPIIERFRTALAESLRDERVAKQLTETQQMTLVLSRPEELRSFASEQARIWGAVVRDNNIRADE